MFFQSVPHDATRWVIHFPIEGGGRPGVHHGTSWFELPRATLIVHQRILSFLDEVSCTLRFPSLSPLAYLH